MKKIQYILCIICLLIIQQKSNAQGHLKMQIANCVATSNEIQFDYLLLNDGTVPLKFNSASMRITHNAAIVPAGTNTIVFTYVGGSDFPAAYATGSSYSLNYTPGTR